MLLDQMEHVTGGHTGQPQQVFNAVPLHISTFKKDWTTSLVDDSAREDLGSHSGESPLDRLADITHPEDLDRVLRAHRCAAVSASATQTEARVIGKDSNYRLFPHHLLPLHDEDGRVMRWCAVRADIDDEKVLRERGYRANIVLRDEIETISLFEGIVGAAKPLQSVLARVLRVAQTDATVMITGETGTGKELIARAIHKRSTRAHRPFVSINCASIPRDLIASELFGHEKGAFTGALQRRIGRFELAEGGTIFLDEIGELPAETQVALLRVLQEREFQRVGGNLSMRADVRVIVATHRDLPAAISAGVFRADLFYRINVFPIRVPPLRERKEDIPLLMKYFIDRYAAKTGKKINQIARKSMDRMVAYSWPGNIRELQNLVERSVILSDGDEFSIDESWLSEDSRRGRPITDELVQQEKEIIESVLFETKGRVSGPAGAAVKLGLPASTLDSKIKTLKINKALFLYA
jgi:transcriptional regulator with GAF, ATPase, and Fis domain